MDNTLLNLDFFNNSYYVRSGSIEHAWYNKELFIEDTGFPFEDGVISLSYEPGRNLYAVEKESQGVLGGLDTPEMQWVDTNFQAILEKGRLRREFETPIITVEMMRDTKLLETDWVLQRHQEETLMGVATTLTTEELTGFLSYRQELRNITNLFERTMTWEKATWPVNPLTGQ
jgi:hypothetical protein